MHRFHRRPWVRALLTLSLLAALAASCAPPERVPVSVFFAGSLLVPFTDLERVYEESHRGVDLLMEGHGSIQVMRHVTDMHEEIDVVVTADHRLIPMLMYATTDPQTGKPFASWYAEFATNQLALAYTERSKYRDEITVDNWYEVLTRRDVRLGLADPRFDAAGYRGLMALQLAEPLYKQPYLLDDVLVGQFQHPIVPRQEEGRWIIHIPEVLATRDGARILVRGSSVQLIALLEAGEVDYAFEYESVIRQHGFQMIDLPREIDLGDEALSGAYDDVVVQLDFQRFKAIEPIFPGETIGYGITVPSNAPHPQEAVEFVTWLLGEEGQRFLTAQHQPLILPARIHEADQAPDAVRRLGVAYRAGGS